MPPDDDVELLQQLAAHGGTQAFSLVPLALKKVIAEWQWQNRRDRHGKAFTSFEAFVDHPLGEGLESTVDDLRAFCRKSPDAMKEILKAIEPERKWRGSTKEERTAHRVKVAMSAVLERAPYRFSRALC